MTTLSGIIPDPPRPPADPDQCCREVFCSPVNTEVFHPIVYHQQVWAPDPFDVETIHQAARETFERLLNRASGQPAPQAGRILLLLGESGSGKTHLMRAFRTHAHGNGKGYFGYLQMTSQVSNYSRYVLNNLIDALDHPYHAPEVQTTGMGRLALGLLEALPHVTPADREHLRDGHVPDLPGLVFDYADQILMDVRFGHLDLNLIRALLFLLRDDPRVRNRALDWLRCEDLAGPDRALLGGLVPQPQDDAPLRRIARLGQLMSAVHAMPLVLCADQLEDTFDQEKAVEQFRRAIDTLVAIADSVPASVVVIACLEDYFEANRQHLARPKLDRLMSDPEPIRLTSQRRIDEIEAMVARRLQVLYEEQGIGTSGLPAAYPFTLEQLKQLENLRTRDVLDHVRRHRERCIREGRWVEPNWKQTTILPPPPSPPDTLPLEQAWNDFRAAFRESIPDDESGLADLLSWAIARCSGEMPDGCHFGAEVDGNFVQVEVHWADTAVDRLLVAVCDRRAPGGGLGRQVAQVERRAGEIPAVLVRSTEFPKSPTAAVTKQIAAMIQRGGRRVVVENADWRAMQAFRAFHEREKARAEFLSWVRQSCPLSSLASVRRILNLEELLQRRPRVEPPPPPATNPALAEAAQPLPERPRPTPDPAPAKQPPSGPLLLGTRAGLAGGPAVLDPADLTRHAAFLGATGSGKTTAALNLIEQLLERGIPAVLVDRKGDLCRYADPSAWGQSAADPQSSRRQRLRERLEVAVYTPGQPEGRPLTLPVVPDGMDQLPTLDREQLAGYAAAALGGMMGYKTRADQGRLAILGKAIEVLGSIPGERVTIPRLREMIENRDDALLSAVGGFEPRQYKKLGEDLLTLWHQHRQLLDGEAERLDIDALLGRGAYERPGKTRLSIISTQFLGDQARVEFWIAQLLVAVSRWASRNGRRELQAVFLFDEADLYLPAQRQPATKAPMDNLLRRGRSAGVSLFLATQNPGDFDYKCRDNICTWLVGRITQTTALNKLRPMFAERRDDASAKLPNQTTGEFYLLREKEVYGLKAAPSLLRTDQLPEERILEIARAGRAGMAAARV